MSDDRGRVIADRVWLANPAPLRVRNRRDSGALASQRMRGRNQRAAQWHSSRPPFASATIWTRRPQIYVLALCAS